LVHSTPYFFLGLIIQNLKPNFKFEYKTIFHINHECGKCHNESPFNRKFRKQEPKMAKTGYIGTAAVLLSAISFIGLGGAIPQPQQAFGDATVDQSISQSASQVGNATD
jgi:hypothetical protein